MEKKYLIRVRQIFYKFVFLFNATANFKSLITFIINSKRYSFNYRRHKVVDTEEFKSYGLNLYDTSLTMFIRTFKGDFDIFYEIFLLQIYFIPESFKVRNYNVIVDLGANVGFFSLYYSIHFPNASIIGVEPDTQNFDILKKNTNSFKNIYIENKAIASENYDYKVILNDYSYNSKIIRDAQNSESKNRTSTVTIPEIIDKYGIDVIDLIKIDIEGGEIDLLENNNDWLKKVNSILIEIHDPVFKESFRDIMINFGFKVFYPNQNNGLNMIYAIKKILLN